MRQKTLTIRYRQALLFTCSVGKFGKSGALGKRRGHVEDSKDDIEGGRIKTRECLLKDVERSKEAVVAYDVGLDGSCEVKRGGVVGGSSTSDERDGNVGDKVGR